MTQNTYLHNVNLVAVLYLYANSQTSSQCKCTCSIHQISSQVEAHTHAAPLVATALLLGHQRLPLMGGGRRGSNSAMSHWSRAQSFWQQHKVSQQVTAGCLSAREGVTSHRDTTSLICHFRSVIQRKRRREGETDRQIDREKKEREIKRERERESFEVQHSVIWADETTTGQTERCWPCGLCHYYVSVCVQMINNLIFSVGTSAFLFSCVYQ